MLDRVGTNAFEPGRQELLQRSLLDESPGGPHSAAFIPVCDRLKSVFEPVATAASPTKLDQLLQALDDAYSRGELFGNAEAIRIARGR